MNFSRRRLLQIAASGVAAPMIIGRAAAQEKQVIVRTPGGAVGDGMLKGVFTPFTKETGITVVPVPISAGKVWAMFKAGNMEIDVLDAAVAQLFDLSAAGALQPLEYNKFKYTDPNDIDAADRAKTYAANWNFATAITYNSKIFEPGKHPANWEQFWDAKKFPGKRILQDIASNELPLEFALIADGVSPDALYPLDVDRAFKSLDRIKNDVVAYYSTAASVLQMLTAEEAALAALWNAQGQAIADKGGPIAVEMNQGMVANMGLAVVTGAKNAANGQLLIDYALQPKSQAALLSNLPYGPSNRRTIALLPKETVAKIPNSPQNASKTFRRDNAWWAENFKAMSERWTRWRAAA